MANERVPEVDIFENDSELLLLANLPGVTKEALTLRIEQDALHVEGRVEADPDGHFAAFSFRRVFELPSGIDGDKAEAELKAGVLHLRLPKSAAQRTRIVPINKAA